MLTRNNSSSLTVHESGPGMLPANLNSPEDVIDIFIRNLPRRETTKKTYRYALIQYMEYLHSTGKTLDEITEEDINDFKEGLTRDGNRHSPLTVATYLAAVKKFYKWTESKKLYPNIAANVERPTNKEYFIKQHLTAEECRELFRYLRRPEGHKERKYNFNRTEEIRLRDYAIIYLMVWTGLRTIEVSRLDVGDITYRTSNNSKVRVLKVWGKGHDTKDSFVALVDDVYEPIREYLDTRPAVNPNEPLFVGEGHDTVGKRLTPRRIQQICKECLRGIGLDDRAYSAHSLRHTTAVQILLNGGDMYDVFYALRHVDPAVSQRYVKSVEQDERLRKSPQRYLRNAFVKDEED